MSTDPDALAPQPAGGQPATPSADPAASLFGLGGVIPDGDVNMNPDQSPTGDQQQQQPPQPVDPALQPPGTEPGVQAPPRPDQEPQQPGQEPLWAKKYQTPEQLERGYVELQSAFTRATQERAADRRELTALKEQLDQFAPVLRQAYAAQDPQFAEALAQQDMLRPLVEEQMAPLRQEWEQQQANAQESQAVQTFYARHPEVTPFSGADQVVTQVMQSLDLTVEPDSLEIALEAAKNPGLYEVLRANPAFVDTDEGMAFARRLSQMVPPQQAQQAVQQVVQSGQLPQGVQVGQAQQPQGGQPPAPAPQGQLQQAFSESAAGGSPQPGAPGGPQAGDIWAEAVSAYRNAQAQSVFGI